MAAAVGCGLIFSSTLATSALWRSSVSLDGGTVRGGSVVLLTGSSAEQVKSYAFTTLTGAGLRPGSSVQAPLVVRNGGISPLGYRLATTSSTGSSVLAGQLRLRLEAVPGSCPAGVGAAAAPVVTAVAYDGPALGATTELTRSLAAGAAETLCVRVTVKPDAPQVVSGTTSAIILTFGAQAP